jgi:hypothetical protein
MPPPQLEDSLGVEVDSQQEMLNLLLGEVD